MAACRWPIGVVDIVYGSVESVRERSSLAAHDGFAHIDCLVGAHADDLALPIGLATAFPKPQPGRCATPAPARDFAPDAWDRAVRWWRSAPGALLEPWAGAVVHSIESWREFLAAVPGTRLLVDVGHVADWGGDPLEMLEWADHVQLRQGCEGSTQLHVDDPRATVDFAAVFARLDELDYDGLVSIEYFDLPAEGWGLPDPRAWALDLFRSLRALR